MRFADVEVRAAPGEIFVVPNNQQMRIEHHPDRAGRWAARWVHIHFTLFGTLDFLHHFKEASGKSPSHYRKQLQEEQAVVSP